MKWIQLISFFFTFKKKVLLRSLKHETRPNSSYIIHGMPTCYANLMMNSLIIVATRKFLPLHAILSPKNAKMIMFLFRGSRGIWLHFVLLCGRVYRLFFSQTPPLLFSPEGSQPQPWDKWRSEIGSISSPAHQSASLHLPDDSGLGCTLHNLSLKINCSFPAGDFVFHVFSLTLTGLYLPCLVL